MKRRTFLFGALATAALTRLSGAEAAAEGTTFVLLHGAWHNSLTWSRVTPFLNAWGHHTLPLDLLGHGVNAQFPAAFFQADRSGLTSEPSPLRELTLDEAATAVLAALPGQVVLVGHSMAGHILSRVAERAPERIQRLVYLTAFMPVERPSFADYMALPEARTELGSGYMLGDPQRLGAARISRERWGRVPRTYIVTERDQAISPRLQRLFIAEADRYTPGNPTRVVSMDTSHSPFASQPQRLAEILGKESGKGAPG